MTAQHRVVLITGASRGLGWAVAERFAHTGARLILTARDSADLAHAAARLSERTDVVAIPGDVADPRHAGRLVREGEARLGSIDVLVNNASDLGATPLPPLERYPVEALERVLRTNAIAPLYLTQLVLPGMRARGRGAIVNVTSDAAVEPYPGWGGYGASKATLEALARVLAVELEGSGVRVYALDPGDMRTRMHAEADPEADPSTLLDPADVAPAVLRLADDPSVPAGRWRASDLLPVAQEVA